MCWNCNEHSNVDTRLSTPPHNLYQEVIGDENKKSRTIFE